LDSASQLGAEVDAKDLTQYKSSVALDTRVDLWFLDSPRADIREDLVPDGRLLGGL
jgi:hypothetical protein